MRTRTPLTSRYTKRALLALGTAAALLLPAAPAAGLGLPPFGNLSKAGLLLPAPPTTSSIPGPTVLSARALPGSLPAKGSTVEVVGKVHGATSCHLAVLGDHGIKVTLPKPASCASGTYREPVGFGPNHTKSAVTVELGLFAKDPFSVARGALYVVVASGPRQVAHPAVVSAKASPWRLGYQGGTVTVEGKVSGAKVCRLAVLYNPGVEVRLPKPAGCTKGTYDQEVTFGPNRRYGAANVELALYPL